MVTFKGITPNPAQTPGITINDSSMTKKAQPGEGMYADLGEFHQKAPAPPTTPVKMPPEYERTEYAEITQFLRVPVKTDDEKENDEKENDEKENDEKENDEKENDEKEDESNVEKNSSPDKGEDPSPSMGEDPSPDMGVAGDRNSSGPVGFVVSI
ncbi:altered inheritance of mitochondria protein 44-like [Stylophora pistillata]|nr:altered inheritance of mitochondria protein 44-like [Stylophora pistillata]